MFDWRKVISCEGIIVYALLACTESSFAPLNYRSNASSVKNATSTLLATLPDGAYQLIYQKSRKSQKS